MVPFVLQYFNENIPGGYMPRCNADSFLFHTATLKGLIMKILTNLL
jgi:hypothetical protein